MALNERQPPALPLQQPAAQLRYALLLDWGTRLGFFTLIASFVIYLFGWLAPHVPVEQLPELWGQPLAIYLERTGAPTGWGWLAQVHEGDFANLVGIALLAGCSLPPLAAVMLLFLRQRDRLLAAICAAQIAVLALAASGLLSVGH